MDWCEAAGHSWRKLGVKMKVREASTKCLMGDGSIRTDRAGRDKQARAVLEGLGKSCA